MCFVEEQLVVFSTSLSSSAGNKVEISNMELSKHSRGDEVGEYDCSAIRSTL